MSFQNSSLAGRSLLVEGSSALISYALDFGDVSSHLCELFGKLIHSFFRDRSFALKPSVRQV